MATSTQEIRQAIIEQLHGHKKFRHLDEKEMEHAVFKRRNLRLTYSGYQALGQLAKCYIYEHDNLFKAKHIMALSNLTYPYYLSNKFFVLFSEEDALMMSLHGDVKTFLEQSNLFRN